MVPPQLDEACNLKIFLFVIEHIFAVREFQRLRESDDGLLLAHKAFWKYPDEVRSDCTITELVYIPDAIEDGLFLLNLQIASFDIDVSPSKPVLYKLLPAS